MEFIGAFILKWLSVTLWPLIISIWQWIVIAIIALWGWLWSPTIRKYTATALLIIVAAIGGTVWGAQHSIVTHKCAEFQQVLVHNAASTKALKIFKQHGLCK